MLHFLSPFYFNSDLSITYACTSYKQELFQLKTPAKNIHRFPQGHLALMISYSAFVQAKSCNP